MKYLALLVVLLLFSSCGIIKGHQNPVVDYTVKAAGEVYVEDNVFEEFVEDSIEDITGLEIDISPSSPEEEE